MMRLAFCATASGRDLPTAAAGRGHCRIPRLALVTVLLLAAGAGGLAVDASAEQASEPTLPAAGGIDAGGFHSCALLTAGALRCWGFGADGQLGYGNTDTIGDNETPAAAGPVSLGSHTATAITTGDAHTCALLDDKSVRCWGFGGDGRLGYNNTNNVLDPGTAGAVDLGTGPLGAHTAKAISAGTAHTCAVLDDGNVRCWGFGGMGTNGTSAPDGRLGYGNTDNIGDNETPGSVGPVNLGLGRTGTPHTAVAISAGGAHTCALLEDGNVRCWGRSDSGQLGYGTKDVVGGTPTTTPDTAGPVDLGSGTAGPHTAVAISVGGVHTCAVLDDSSVRCWGENGSGQLGYGNRNNIGDDETPAMAGAVDLGSGPTGMPHRAVAISASSAHTCAVLDDASVRCWGFGGNGRLGYGNTTTIGDDELPGSVGPVDLGAGRSAVAISAGSAHTCARLDGGSVRCWGLGVGGRLGYCDQVTIGDTETPGSAGPVKLGPGDGGADCPPPAPPSPPTSGALSQAPDLTPDAPPTTSPPPTPPDAAVAALAAEKLRAAALRGCLARAARRPARRAKTERRDCRKRYGRTPGPIGAPAAQPSGAHAITLTFGAAGSDSTKPPAARSYLIKQSSRPIGGKRDFDAADALCKGSCGFRVTEVGDVITLTIDQLEPHSTYYYAIAGRDNVSARLGPRSRSVKARTG